MSEECPNRPSRSQEAVRLRMPAKPWHLMYSWVLARRLEPLAPPKCQGSKTSGSRRNGNQRAKSVSHASSRKTSMMMPYSGSASAVMGGTYKANADFAWHKTARWVSWGSRPQTQTQTGDLGHSLAHKRIDPPRRRDPSGLA